ncbi:Cuticle protein 16.8 [Halotydeus destructor]|nr:Cuticle protein 16.8 [Halotydeus destructor]
MSSQVCLALLVACLAAAHAQLPLPLPFLLAQPPVAVGGRGRQPVLATAEARSRAALRPSPVSAALEAAAAFKQPMNPYNFAYDVHDETGNHQYRKEEATDGVVRGTYGYTDANGLYRFVSYVADGAGFRASIQSNEPGMGQAQAADVKLSAEEPPVVAAASAVSPVAAPVVHRVAPVQARRQRQRQAAPATSEATPTPAAVASTSAVDTESPLAFGRLLSQ